MKTLSSLLSTVALSALLIFTGCDSDDTKPAVQFTTKINGQVFTPKILDGRFFPQDQFIDVEAHELDETFDNQYVFGVQIEYSALDKPVEYNFTEQGMYGNVIFYFFSNDGKTYLAEKGTLKIKKINTKTLEATFSSLDLKSGHPDAPAITLTDGKIRVDLAETND